MISETSSDTLRSRGQFKGTPTLAALPPPNNVTIQFGQSWAVIVPSVYRYEDDQWIDEFFASGKIRLSTFAKFATYKDEIRGDPNEGFAVCGGRTNDQHTIFIVQRQGISAVVLCCSHKLDRKLAKGFQRNSAFQITNTVGFAMEISRQLPGFQHGIEGSCIYRSKPHIHRELDFDVGRYRRADGTFDMQMMRDAGHALGGPELVLLKRKQYEPQQEYRLLWELDTVAGDFVDVVAPQARQYCRKVEASEWGP